MNTTDKTPDPQSRSEIIEEALKEISKTHAQRVTEANQSALKQYHLYTSQNKLAYAITIGSYIVFIVVSIALIVISVVMGFQPGTSPFSMALSVGFFIAGIILILILMGKNPLRLVRHSMMEMIKVNVVFTGFMRQLYQIDSGFQKMLKTVDSSGVAEIKAISTQLHTIIEKSIDAFTLLMNDFEE